VADQGTNDVAAFLIGKDGKLSKTPGSPFGVPVSAAWMTSLSR
jgi:hypothetical protein